MGSSEDELERADEEKLCRAVDLMLRHIDF